MEQINTSSAATRQQNAVQQILRVMQQALTLDEKQLTQALKAHQISDADKQAALSQLID